MSETPGVQTEFTENSYPIVDGCVNVLKWFAVIAVLGSCVAGYTPANIIDALDADYKLAPTPVISADAPRKSVRTKGGLVEVDVLENWVPSFLKNEELVQGELHYFSPRFNHFTFFSCGDSNSEHNQWLVSLSVEEWNNQLLSVLPEDASIVSSSSEEINEHDIHLTTIEYSDKNFSGRITDALSFSTRYDVGDQHCVAEYLMSKSGRNTSTHKKEFLRILASAKRIKNPKK